MKWLKPGTKSEDVFKVMDKTVAAFDYCKIHGLRKVEM